MTNREYILSLNDRQLAILLLHYEKVRWRYQEAKAKRKGNIGKPEEFNRYGWQNRCFVGNGKMIKIPFHANDLLLTQIFLDDEYKPEYYEYTF